MQQVVGTGCVEQLVPERLDFPEPALEILEWRRSVVVREAEALAGGVTVSGTVRTRCLVWAPAPGANTGQVLCQGIDTPFVVRIRLRGARIGMKVTVTDAVVAGDDVRPIYTGDGRIAAVCSSVVVAVRARVSRPARRRQVKPKPPRRRRVQAATPAPKPEAPPPVPPRRREPPDAWVHPSAAIPYIE